jgi:hypothetical protein
MSNIPEIPKNDFLKKAFKTSQENTKAYKKSAQEPSPSSLQKEDTVSLSSMNKWIKILEEMPEPELSQAQLQAVEESSKMLNSDLLDKEVLPKIIDDILTDWNLKSS